MPIEPSANVVLAFRLLTLMAANPLKSFCLSELVAQAESQIEPIPSRAKVLSAVTALDEAGVVSWVEGNAWKFGGVTLDLLVASRLVSLMAQAQSTVITKWIKALL